MVEWIDKYMGKKKKRRLKGKYLVEKGFNEVNKDERDINDVWCKE